MKTFVQKIFNIPINKLMTCLVLNSPYVQVKLKKCENADMGINGLNGNNNNLLLHILILFFKLLLHKKFFDI